MTGRAHNRRDGVLLAASACWIALLLTCLATAAAAKPTLSIPRLAQQGQTTAASVNPHGSRGCRLIARALGNRRQSRRVPGRRATLVYLTIAKRARIGVWELRLRCVSGTSAAEEVHVRGSGRRAGRVLFSRLQSRRPGGRRPDGYTNPRRNQNDATGPGVGITPEERSGEGGADGGRVTGP